MVSVLAKRATILSQRRKKSRCVLSAPCKLFGALMLAAASPAALSQPVVDGLFFGTGEDALYTPYQTSENGSVLYSYLDISTTTLYVALVVNQANVNDTVCSPQSDNAYTQSAGWPNHRSCKRLTDSEFASWTLQCAPGSVNSWSWQQAFGCPQTAGPPPSSWVSDSTCGPSSPAADWPPGVEGSSTTSWVANINTYQNAGTPLAWNLYESGLSDDNWKSPFVPSMPDDVTQVPGYPVFTTYGETFGNGPNIWEWPLVYEWSVQLGAGGTDCADQTIFFITGLSHHSPSKSGDENDDFPPPENPEMSDWGDLPDTYGTFNASNGARHLLKVTGPYLGPDLQPELDGSPTADATGDGPEEGGVTFVVDSFWTPGQTRQIEVEVGNASSGALLAGWFDWNNDGDFDDPGEFFTWNVSEGSNTLDLTVGAGFDWQNDDLYSRFRIFTDESEAPGGTLEQADYVGLATDGEVEDYYNPPDTLPVSLNAFSSRFAGGGLDVEWQTASETNNVGFEIWGQGYDGEWRTLSEFIASQGMNSALPQTYRETVSGGSDIRALSLVDYDTRGRAERFGPFTPGESYGEVQPVDEIDWEGPRLRRQQRLEARGFVNTTTKRFGKSEKRANQSSKRFNQRSGHRTASALIAGFSNRERFRKLIQESPGSGPKRQDYESEPISVSVPSLTQSRDDDGPETVTLQTGPSTHVAVTEPGIQRVGYESLRDGGLDLAGMRHEDIAVTWRGQPVARWIGGSGEFGPGHWIEFVGRPPRGDDALYIDSNLYQVSIDASLARDAGQIGKGRAQNVSASYQSQSIVDRPLTYNPQSATGDPWVERNVLVRGSKTVALDIPVAGPVAAGAASVIVHLGTMTDLRDVTDGSGNVVPEHNVEVELRKPGSEPVHITTASTSGQRDWKIEAGLPPGFLEAGTYELLLHFHTEYMYSLLTVDRYGVRYAAPYRGSRLDFAPDEAADGYRIENFSSPSMAAYAEGADGSLTRIDPRVEFTGNGYTAELRQLDAARIWVDANPHTPDVFTTQAPGDLVSMPAGLVVIAESSLVGTPALDAYVDNKAAFNPIVVDVEDIYNSAGYGMALPSAINDYLRAREEIHPFTHVQLVGTDCYDRLNYISQCISFIPLPNAPVGVNIYSPSQNRLVDLDGDGVGDKPVAQFSVRDASELATIVDKGSSWHSNVSGLKSALLVADDTDGTHDFLGQIERLDERIDWEASEVLNMADHPDVATAREAFKTSLDSGRALTIFSGHSGPSIWSFRALLTADSAITLGNAGRPTMMVPLACQTTYDISPDANVLGHQLMYAGDRGAVAISGAVSLSGLDNNELMANHIIDALKSGLTLGEAVQSGRESLGPAFGTLHDNWITQGDVTTKLAP